MVPKVNQEKLEETLTVTLEDLSQTVRRSDKKTKKRLSPILDKLIATCEEELGKLAQKKK